MEDRIVLVEWEDTNGSHGWQLESELPGLAEIKSVGFVVAENDEAITLIESISEADAGNRPGAQHRRFGCATIIPLSAVHKVTELGLKGG